MHNMIENSAHQIQIITNKTDRPGIDIKFRIKETICKSVLDKRVSGIGPESINSILSLFIDPICIAGAWRLHQYFVGELARRYTAADTLACEY